MSSWKTVSVLSRIKNGDQQINLRIIGGYDQQIHNWTKQIQTWQKPVCMFKRKIEQI